MTTHQTFSPLTRGNIAVRNKDYVTAIGHYIYAARNTPELAKILAYNIRMAQQKYHNQRALVPRLRIAVSSTSLTDGIPGRIHALTNLYDDFADIELIGLSSQSGCGEDTEQAGTASKPTRFLTILDDNDSLNRAIDFVASSPFDTVHLFKPCARTLLIGTLYKIIWDAKVLVDIDETLLPGEAELENVLDTYLQGHRTFPALSSPNSEEWRKIALILAREFDGITTSGAAVQQRFGGEIISFVESDGQKLHSYIEITPRKPFTHTLGKLSKILLPSFGSLPVELVFATPYKTPLPTIKTAYDRPSCIDEKQFELIKKSDLFDPAWYVQENSTKHIISENPLEHFLTIGSTLGLNPSPKFNTLFYLKANQDVAAAGVNPLIHYVAQGMNEGRQCLPAKPLENSANANQKLQDQPPATPDRSSLPPGVDEHQFQLAKQSDIFDPAWYIQEYGSKHSISGDPLEHFLNIGIGLGLNPSPKFNTLFYLKANQDVAAAGVNPFIHYVAQGMNEGRQCLPAKPLENSANANQKLQDQSPATPDRGSLPPGVDEHQFQLAKQSDIFDPAWYIQEYGSEHSISGDPLEHFLNVGIGLGLNPSPKFNTLFYLKANQDVAAAGVNPFIHYVAQGMNEGRQCLPVKANEISLHTSFKTPIIYHSPLKEKPARLICFYLPQFHAIPENDAWWGEGFTEWTNVKPAQPQFDGHYQPRLPGELGYYNLLDKSTQKRQIELAKLYGIEGFCFYFYWFGGKRLLEQPILNYLNDPTLDLPFCLCWANENWSRRWDGLDAEILIAQNHSPEDDIAFISYLSQYLRDPRYIRVDGKPLVILYRPSLLPSIRETVKRWRDWCRAHEVGEIHLAYTQSFENVDPSDYGFDAAIEFSPNNSSPALITDQLSPLADDFACKIYDWTSVSTRSEQYKQFPYKLYRGACPSWDNTPRRKNNSTVFLNNTPDRYQRWLENAIQDTRNNQALHDDNLVFINAWNEWAEGAYLEPDERNGYAYLNATLKALLACSGHSDHAALPNETPMKHQAVYDARWSRLDALFSTMLDRALYSFLADYLALFLQAAQNEARFFTKDHIPCCELNGETFSLDTRSGLARLATKLRSMDTFCFVILQYNKVELTAECVESIRRLHSYNQKTHIIIVDNKSRDDVITRTRDMFSSARDVTVLYSDTNLGFSGGNNLGYVYARDTLKADFIVVLNNDTQIEQKDFIEQTLHLFDRWAFSIAGPDVMISDGRHENPWNDYVYSVDEWKTLHTTRNQERERYVNENKAAFSKMGRSSPEQEIILNPILQGAAYIVSPIFVADHPKLFDERLFLYGEEFLLAIECLLSGHLMLYTNTLQIQHLEGATTETLPNHDKLMLGYDSSIHALDLCLGRLERNALAHCGTVVDPSNLGELDELFVVNGPHVLVDLFFCQPGFHGGGEYGKAIFKKLVETYATNGGFQLWAALNPTLFIDPWVWEACRNYSINIVEVYSYNDIIRLVNSDRFDSFYAPAIVVYADYEYMKKVGTKLPFTCKKTRVIGTLLDIRDFEVSRDRRRILETRRKNGCLKELQMSETELENEANASLELAEALRKMYIAIIEDSVIDTIVTISDYCDNSIQKNIGTPCKPIKVFMAPMKPRPQAEPFADAPLDFSRVPYALLVHAGREEKNGASAIRAFDQLFDEYGTQAPLGELHVVLTGITALNELGIEDIHNPERFIPLGEIAPAQFEYILQHARMLVYPSFNEGFGYPPIEAMIYNVQSIVSEVTAIPEVCGEAVIYFNPYEINSIKTAVLESLEKPTESSKRMSQYEFISSRQARDLNALIELVTNIGDKAQSKRSDTPALPRQLAEH